MDQQLSANVKVGATSTYRDMKLAVKAGADVVVVDGMQVGTAARQEVFIEHVGIPTLAAIVEAVRPGSPSSGRPRALQEMDMHRKVQLIVSGGIRNGAGVAKCVALGADAVSVGTAALIALGENLTMEAQIIGRACGKAHLHHLEPADLAALTIESAAITPIPLVGTSWVPGSNL